MIYYALNVAENLECQEPGSYKEAVACEERDQWVMAMRDEIHSLEKKCVMPQFPQERL